jgi:CarD family transcriptional regulator
MAQKMAPSKVASKKAAHKKPTARKHSPASAQTAKAGAKIAKAKPAVAAQPPKRTAKAAPVKVHPQVKLHPQKHVAAKSAPQARASLQKAGAKEAAKAHPAPRHEAAGKAAAPAAPPKATPTPPPVVARPAAPTAGRSMPAAATAGQKIMAPAHPVSAPAVTKPIASKHPVAPAQQPIAGAAAPAKKDKALQQKLGFKVNEWIVYPAHGVGRIVAIEDQEIAGISLELFVITFEKDKMTLRVPTGKSASVGMRKLAEEATVKKAIETLKGRARVKRTMWSRRAQEYEAKINSGDLIAIAEVVRDLYRSESQPEQSYSERQLYEAALDRMAREIAVVEKLDERGAVQRITEVLSKSARGRSVAAEAA